MHTAKIAFSQVVHTQGCLTVPRILELCLNMLSSLPVLNPYKRMSGLTLKMARGWRFLGWFEFSLYFFVLFCFVFCFCF